MLAEPWGSAELQLKITAVRYWNFVCILSDVKINTMNEQMSMMMHLLFRFNFKQLAYFKKLVGSFFLYKCI